MVGKMGWFWFGLVGVGF